MSHSSILICATLALSGPIALAQTSVQGSAATQSQTSLSANRDGASATHSSSGAVSADASKAGAGDASADLASGSHINATLSKPVDSGKAKPGDEVTATAAEDIKSNGRVVIPR